MGLDGKLVFWMRISILPEKVPLLFPRSLIVLLNYIVISSERVLKNVNEDMPTLPLREYRNHLAFVFSDSPDKFHVTPRVLYIYICI